MIKVDDIVRVRRGPYAGMNGIVQSIDAKMQAKVSIRGVGIVEIPTMFLKVPKGR